MKLRAALPLLVRLPVLGLVLLTGCHSAYVEATVHNATSKPITLLEVDYPSASFGRGSLDPNEDFHYRLKLLGSGGTKVLWTDENRHEHSIAGPVLREGQEGSIRIEIESSTARWQTDLRSIR